MKRVIFTLLHDRGSFMLSRNFRLQKVGTVTWLFDNYDFASISRGLDELMVLDVTRGQRDPAGFAEKVKHIASRCFIPMTVGGGITSLETAKMYTRSGADKLLVNTSFSKDPSLCEKLSAHFGRQCIIAGIDYRAADGGPAVTTGNGSEVLPHSLQEWVEHVEAHGAGEILFQSMDKDGTGMGLDLSFFTSLRRAPDLPCIVMGGIGKAEHVIDGLKNPLVDAVATANLFNFIASTFLDVRRQISASGLEIAQWNDEDYASLKGMFGGS